MTSGPWESFKEGHGVKAQTMGVSSGDAFGCRVSVRNNRQGVEWKTAGMSHLSQPQDTVTVLDESTMAGLLGKAVSGVPLEQTAYKDDVPIGPRVAHGLVAPVFRDTHAGKIGDHGLDIQAEGAWPDRRPLRVRTGGTGSHQDFREQVSNHQEAGHNRDGAMGRLRVGEAVGMEQRSIKSETPVSHHDINVTGVKEMISTLSTTRHLAPWGRYTVGCKNKTYSGHSKASIIVTFHENEKVSRILHTVHSILQRTPSTLLEEVILIDDHSKKEDLKEILQIYVKSVFGSKVSLHSNWLKKGLIGARLAGTRIAKGDFIVCMDSHMEVQDNWLQPLLLEIRNNPKTLAASYLDWMEYNMHNGKWTYRHGASTWKTYFDWTFTFGFQDIPTRVKNARNPSDPIPSPVTIGTIFAIDKQFFREVGEFDDEMVGWGGENLDLPLRVWMFGGRVVNVPCSHVAHIEEAGQRNYRLGWEHDIVRNYRRVADVWLGEERLHVYRYKPNMQGSDPGDLTSRLALKRNSVHNFTWFLDNVFPELGIPGKHVFAWGMLKNLGSNLCLSASPPNAPSISDCVGRRPAKTEFSWSVTGELRFPLHAFSAVRGYSESALRTDEWITYYNTSMLSKWIHWKGGPLLEWSSRHCLSAAKGTYRLLLSTCNFTSPYQQWTFSSYTDAYTSLSTGTTATQSPSRPNDGPFVASYIRALRDAADLLQQGAWESLYKITYQPIEPATET